jgi:Protein of unknown function (DUF3137)
MTTAENKKGPWDNAPDWMTLTGEQAFRLYGDSYLAALKPRRYSALRWHSRRPFLMLGGGLIGLIVAGFFAEPVVAIGALLAGLGIGAVIPSIIATRGTADVRSALQNCVAAALQLKPDTSPDRPMAAQRAIDARLVPGFDRSQYSACYSGDCDGIEFEICRAHLEKEETTSSMVNGRMRTRTEWVTVFDGIMLNFALRRQLDTPIRLRGDRLLGTFFESDDRINYVHPDFNDRFTVYCHDPLVAKYIIHPVMVETLIGLDQEFDGNKLIGDFAGQRFTGMLSEFRPFGYGDINPDHDIKAMDALIAEWQRLRHLMHSISEPE